MNCKFCGRSNDLTVCEGCFTIATNRVALTVKSPEITEECGECRGKGHTYRRGRCDCGCDDSEIPCSACDETGEVTHEDCAACEKVNGSRCIFNEARTALLAQETL